MEKINAVGAQGKTPRNENSDSEEEAKYLDREVADF